MEFNKAVIRAEITIEDKNSQALLVLAIQNPDSLIYWNSYLLRDQIPENSLNRMRRIEGEFWLPLPLPGNSTISAYIWNLNKENLTLHEFKIILE